MTTAENVRVAVTGTINYGPAGTALPEDAVTALDAAFDEVGYAGEDGIVQTINEDRTDIKAWQNGDVVRKVRTSHDVTYSFTMLETNLTSLEIYYGDGSVSGTLADGVVEVRGDAGTRGEWVLHVIDGDNLIRIVLPDGEVTERGDVNFVNAEAIAYPVTVTAYPDVDGVKAYLYLAADGS
jgi:hypothetical protein